MKNDIQCETSVKLCVAYGTKLLCQRCLKYMNKIMKNSDVMRHLQVYSFMYINEDTNQWPTILNHLSDTMVEVFLYLYMCSTSELASDLYWTQEDSHVIMVILCG